jgi:predicted O-methyltransferase YrrM
MNLENALKIQGCMEPDELQWLAEQASRHERIVEVGSFLGRSTRAMADNTSGWVLAFDDWFGPRDINMDGRDHIYEVFRKNMNGLVESGKVMILQGDHGDLNVIPVGLQPDMVFIDGAHEYESVKRDLQIWKNKIIIGGLICGHDAQMGSVQQALREELPGCQIVLRSTVGTMIWGTYYGTQ